MVEQVDRDAAVNAVSSIVDDGFVVGCCAMSETDGHEFSAYLSEAFAAHRIATEARVVEAAAEIADNWGVGHPHIAKAIRASIGLEHTSEVERLRALLADARDYLHDPICRFAEGNEQELISRIDAALNGGQHD